MYRLDETVREMQLVEVFSDSTGGYEWAEIRAWRAPSGRFLWFEDSGCSCTSFGDGFDSAADLSDGDRDALERAYRRWGDGREYYDGINVIEGVEKLRQL